jgi:HEAT repeat protein
MLRSDLIVRFLKTEEGKRILWEDLDVPKTDSVPNQQSGKNVRDLLLASDVPVIAALLDSTGDDTVRNEAANLLRRSGYEGLTDDLTRMLDNPAESERFKAFCVQHLWYNVESANPEELEKIITVLQRTLGDQHIPVRREALLALVRLGDPKGAKTAVEWLTDEKAGDVRDAAIRCVHDLNMKEYIPTIRKYLYDPDEVIRIAAIVALSQWGDEESRPAFSAAAKSDSIRLQRAGQAALTRLSQPIKTP